MSDETVTGAVRAMQQAAHDELARQHPLLKQIAAELTVMMGSATPDFEGGCDGQVMGYKVRTGAVHKIIGLLSGAGHSVIVPTPFGLRNGRCCGHTAKCRDNRCLYASRDPVPDDGVALPDGGNHD